MWEGARGYVAYEGPLVIEHSPPRVDRERPRARLSFFGPIFARSAHSSCWCTPPNRCHNKSGTALWVYTVGKPTRFKAVRSAISDTPQASANRACPGERPFLPATVNRAAAATVFGTELGAASVNSRATRFASSTRTGGRSNFPERTSTSSTAFGVR